MKRNDSHDGDRGSADALSGQCAEPGPNMVLILQAALARGRSEAVAVSLGVTSGSVLLALTASTGLQAVLFGRKSARSMDRSRRHETHGHRRGALAGVSDFS
ncbi:LysE family transporter [Paractinoplanes toevensis]|uniref:LysE family transporter n=1 Tax=Paractinoplanes toevensis TaxID=571911 RepID=UPI001BB3F0E6